MESTIFLKVLDDVDVQATLVAKYTTSLGLSYIIELSPANFIPYYGMRFRFCAETLIVKQFTKRKSSILEENREANIWACIMIEI
jgi:hypothetical protein